MKSRLTLPVILTVALYCFGLWALADTPPTRQISAAEVCMHAAGDKAVKEIAGCVRIEFINVNEENTLAHQDKRTYSGIGYAYDKDGKHLGTTVHWYATAVRKKGTWLVDKESVEVQTPKPTPIGK